jgi:hypothetical protein
MKWFGKQLGEMNLVSVLAASFLSFFLVARTIRMYFEKLYSDLSPVEEETEIKGFEANGTE